MCERENAARSLICCSTKERETYGRGRLIGFCVWRVAHQSWSGETRGVWEGAEFMQLMLAHRSRKEAVMNSGPFLQAGSMAVADGNGAANAPSPLVCLITTAELNGGVEGVAAEQGSAFFLLPRGTGSAAEPLR